MKDNKRILILRILMIILVLIIVSITILFIINKEDIISTNDTDTEEIIGYWTLYKVEFVEEEEITYSLATSDLTLDIKQDTIEICYIDKECNNISYTYSDTLNLLEYNEYLNGNYKVVIDDDTMILEQVTNEENNTVIRSYFIKPKG